MSNSDTMSHANSKATALRDMVLAAVDQNPELKALLMQQQLNNGKLEYTLKPLDIANLLWEKGEGGFPLFYFSGVKGQAEKEKKNKIVSRALSYAREEILKRNSRSRQRQELPQFYQRSVWINGSGGDDVSEVTSVGLGAGGGSSNIADAMSISLGTNTNASVTFGSDDMSIEGASSEMTMREMSRNFAVLTLGSASKDDMSLTTDASAPDNMSYETTKSQSARTSSAGKKTLLNPIVEETKEDDASEMHLDNEKLLWRYTQNTLLIQQDPHLEKNHKDWMYHFMCKEFSHDDPNTPKSNKIILKLQRKTESITKLLNTPHHDVAEEMIQEKKEIIDEAIGSIRSG